MALETSTNDSLRMLRGGCRCGSEMNRPLEIKVLLTVGATRRPVPYEILGRLNFANLGPPQYLDAGQQMQRLPGKFDQLVRRHRLLRTKERPPPRLLSRRRLQRGGLRALYIRRRSDILWL